MEQHFNENTWYLNIVNKRVILSTDIDEAHLFADEETAKEFVDCYDFYDYEIISKQLEDGMWAIVKVKTLVEPKDISEDEDAYWW